MSSQAANRRSHKYVLPGMIVVFVMVILNFWSLNRNNNHERRYIGYANDIQVYS